MVEGNWYMKEKEWIYSDTFSKMGRYKKRT